jgi:hypothetical protein
MVASLMNVSNISFILFVFILTGLSIFPKEWLIRPRVKKLKKMYKSQKYKVLAKKFKQF